MNTLATVIFILIMKATLTLILKRLNNAFAINRKLRERRKTSMMTNLKLSGDALDVGFLTVNRRIFCQKF